MTPVQMPWTHWAHIYQVQDILAGTWKVHIRQSGQWDLVYLTHVKKGSLVQALLSSCCANKLVIAEIWKFKFVCEMFFCTAPGELNF